MPENAPNILHIFTDQQRFDTISALGNQLIKTPNLDRLVREGTAFQRAYSPSPECVPARASMITGWYPTRTECYCNEQPMPPVDTPTLMSLLSDAGYQTMGIGKCHFSPNSYALRGFQQRVSQEETISDRSADNYSKWLVDNGWGWVIEPHGVRSDMYYIPQVSVLPEHAHPVGWIGDQVLNFLETKTDSEKPWYCYAGFIHPHPPFAPPIPWHKEYRAPEMPLPEIPEDCEDLLSFINHFQNRYKYRDRGLDLNLVRSIRAYYYACITFIDHQVGRILDSLEQSGQLDNTLIVFSADHGEYLGDFGSFGKRGMHDVSARIPLLVRWPAKSNAGTICSRVASLVDLAPTFLDVAGISYDSDDFDGISLRLIADGSIRRDSVYSQYGRAENGLYMLVGERWKYVYSAPDQKEYLFDLKSDALEHTNLVGQLEFEVTLGQMREKCISWLHEQGEVAAVADDDWRLYPKQKVSTNPDDGLLCQDPPWWVKEKDLL
ncbi:sulfatase family protein [Rubellicoccus peritrichatus]|uniref:Sulfatase-like hydrolase/transferase n=1 Tax=Rubellicoccus peritrichatus TaxID=3080537 RepID=A0AAQ3QUI1_9BACT|nr:sulfatase-like hydrolase/transferase [Puniceicoccus sp. CR14]WOO39752.1 sulfatase-like hydrolase/transferase [Puniceicoccus sp. CR14]